MCAQTFFFSEVDSGPLNNSHTERKYRSSGQGRKQKYLNVFPFERLMAEVFVTNRVECWNMAFTEMG